MKKQRSTKKDSVPPPTEVSPPSPVEEVPATLPTVEVPPVVEEVPASAKKRPVKKSAPKKTKAVVVEEEVAVADANPEPEVPIVEETEASLETPPKDASCDPSAPLWGAKTDASCDPSAPLWGAKTDVAVDDLGEPKKRGRRPKAKEQVYSLMDDEKEAGGGAGEEPKTSDLGSGERLILHLPISSEERKEEPAPYQSGKLSLGSPFLATPMPTYDLEGRCSVSGLLGGVSEPPSYRDLAEEVKVEKKDYTICFSDSMQDTRSDLSADFSSKVKEFKLGAFIQTIPKGSLATAEATATATADDYYVGGMLMKSVGKAPVANPFQEEAVAPSASASAGAGAGAGAGALEEPNKMSKKRLQDIMVEFVNANMYQEWPDQTHIHCWWCCHPFEGPPCCLPEYMRRDKFYVSGCFCTFNCAAAYNFSKNDNDMWERYTLLNLMYKRLFQTQFKKIELAPPREVLKIFGGFMTIEEFRAHCLKQEKSFQVIMPPLISIIPKIEENVHPRQGAVNEHILNKTQSKLKLTRTKPAIQEKSSIHSFMKITTIQE